MVDDIEALVPEYEQSKKSRLWYLVFILIALILVAFAYFTNNYTFIGVIVLGSILIIMRNERKPRMIMFAIHKDGIYVKNRLYEFKDIKNYSIYESGGKHYFTFTTGEKFPVPIIIPISNPEEIRRKLNNLVTEVEYQESLLDTLVRFLGL